MSEARLLIIIVERERAIERVLGGLYGLGVRATVLRSEGMQQALDEDLPLFAAFAMGTGAGPTHHRTILAVIDDPALLAQATELAVEVCAEYEGERTGVVFTVPVDLYRHL